MRMMVKRFVVAMVAGILLPVFSSAVEARSVQMMAAGGGQIRGLVVGINDYSARWIQTLRGAVADAQDLEKTFREAGVSDLTVLIDASATRQNFVAAMNRLIDVSKTGDLVIISFAGHGSQEPELVKGSESDGNDEIFLLHGFDNVGSGTTERIIDDEMNHWLLQLAQKKIDVLYIADTCHGGGMMRSPDFRSGDVSYRFAAISMEPQNDKLKPISTVADAQVSPDDLPNVTFLAAVNKLSKAPEVRVPKNETLRGALSYAVARSVSDGHDGVVTRRELFGYARQLTYRYSQTIQTITTEPTGKSADLDKPVFRLKVTGEVNDAPVNDVVRLFIRGGDANLLSGISPGQFQFRITKKDEDTDVVWDPASGDVLNGYGDVIAKSARASDVPASVDAIGAMLAITKLSESGLQSMKLLPNDARFRTGEIIKFHIEGLTGKYLILVDLSGNGRVHFLYPRLREDTALIAGQNFDLPLKVEEPFGSDHLIAIVSDKRLEQGEGALSAIDEQRVAGKLVGILGSLHLSDPSVRFGMAASFTAP